MAPVLRRETDDAVVDGGDGGEIEGVCGGRILICHVCVFLHHLQLLRDDVVGGLDGARKKIP